MQEFYPINYLRNVALNYTSAKYVFLSDVDFAPNYGLHKYLQSFIDDGELELKKVILALVWHYFCVTYVLYNESDRYSDLLIMNCSATRRFLDRITSPALSEWQG